jgi:drug/metabolite transporter (DMT)-like permease
MTTTRHTHLDARATGLLIVCCAFWGFQQTLIKSTVAEVPPLWQAALRMGGALALLWLWCLWRRVPLWQRDGTLRGGLLAGALFAGEFVCLYLGLQYTSASRVTIFLYTSPFTVALLLPRLVPAERLRAVQWAGLALAFAAVALAFSESLGHSSNTQLMGDALALAAGTLWGLTTLAVRGSPLATASAEKALFYQLAVTTVLMPLASLAKGEAWSLAYPVHAWLSIALQAGVGAFASYLAWMWIIQRYPATQVSSFTFLTPLFALVFGVLLLREPLTARLVLALAGVAAGIVLVNRRA